MRIRIFRPFADPYRASMDVVAEQLVTHLRMRLQQGDEIGEVQARPFGRGRLGRYLSQYVAYQVRATLSQGEVNHVLDHSFGHLVYTLNWKRTVVTVHDCILLKLAHRLSRNGCRDGGSVKAQRYSLRGARRAAAVLADSECTRQDFIAFTGCDPARVSVIHCGVEHCRAEDAGPWAEAARRKFGLAGGPYVLHVGHSLFYKNLEGVLRVVHALAAKMGIRAELIKVGAPLTEGQRGLAEALGVAGRVREVGWVSSQELTGIYAIADVLLFPSWYEGFGLPVVEAMACGLPVVASNAGSLPEVAGDAALLFDPADTDGLAEAVRSILQDSALREDLVRRGLENARRFSWGRAAEETLSVYRRVARMNTLVREKA